jgi:hypothetical protein
MQMLFVWERSIKSIASRKVDKTKEGNEIERVGPRIVTFLPGRAESHSERSVL